MAFSSCILNTVLSVSHVFAINSKEENGTTNFSKSPWTVKSLQWLLLPTGQRENLDKFISILSTGPTTSPAQGRWNSKENQEKEICWNNDAYKQQSIIKYV